MKRVVTAFKRLADHIVRYVSEEPARAVSRTVAAIVFAAALFDATVDAAALSETLERIVTVLLILGGGEVTRRRVTPVRRRAKQR